MKYVSGPYIQGQLLRDIHEVEIALTERFLRNGVITDAAEQRSWRERVEDASFGQNTVMFDDQGNPSVMVVFPLQTEDSLLAGASNMPHPAFLVNEAIKPLIYISKYQCFTSGSGATLRAIGLKHRDPATFINFDNALLACSQKGSGWHLMTNAEWAAIALYSKKRGFLPRGNSYNGASHLVASEKGIPCFYDTVFSGNKMGRILTGSGPNTWSHDGTPFGIFDLCGNVWELVGGTRLNDGEIQILANNNAADSSKSQSAVSTEWQAILQDGSLVSPGTADTLKVDNTTVGDSLTNTHDVGGDPIINTTVTNPMYIPRGEFEYGYSSCSFKNLTASGGVNIPNLLKLLALFPIDGTEPGGFSARNYGEKMLHRGGCWLDSGNAGIFSYRYYGKRIYANEITGFRAAYIN